MKILILLATLSGVAFSQIGPPSGPPSSGPGSGTVTSVTIAGTTNQINVTGTCTITTTGTCTLSLPAGLVLPGTINGLTITTTTGTLTIASAKVLTVSNSLTLAGTDGVTLTFPTTSATIARTDAGQTFTGTQNMTAALQSSSTAVTQSQNNNSTAPATTAYTDLAVANAVAGVNPAVSVLAASTATVTGTYLNGVAGIGATFTVTATGTFSLDGIAINTIGQRVLLKDQSSGFQNGVYTATIVGALAVSPVFTRALDYDTPSDINSTGAIPVQSGTVNGGRSYLLTSTVNTVGTDALTYTIFSYSATTTLYGPIPITGASFIRIQMSGLVITGSGNNDLYTVPAGKRLVVGAITVRNDTGGNVVWYPELKFSAAYWRLASNTTTGTGVTSPIAGVSMVFEPGDTLAINTATTAGGIAYVNALLFDSSVAMFSPRLLGSSTGTVNLYTVTTGKSATLLPISFTGVPPPESSGGGFVIVGGSTQTFTFYDVPFGGSAGATNLVNVQGATANTRVTVTGPITMASGDFIAVNNSAGDAANAVWANVIEF